MAKKKPAAKDRKKTESKWCLSGSSQSRQAPFY